MWSAPIGKAMGLWRQCWNGRDSMYAATLYNVYWSVYLAGFSHCNVKSSRQLQLSLSTGRAMKCTAGGSDRMHYTSTPEALLRKLHCLVVTLRPARYLCPSGSPSGLPSLTVHPPDTGQQNGSGLGRHRSRRGDWACPLGHPTAYTTYRTPLAAHSP
jgi:hypothetical protein